MIGRSQAVHNENRIKEPTPAYARDSGAVSLSTILGFIEMLIGWGDLYLWTIIQETYRTEMLENVSIPTKITSVGLFIIGNNRKRQCSSLETRTFQRKYTATTSVEFMSMG